MTTAAGLRAAYARDGASTASPNRLLLLLLDRMCLDADLGAEAIDNRDFATSGKRLTNAQAILMQLRTSLDLKAWPQGRTTADLYVWCYKELIASNMTGDSARVRTTLPIMRELRDSWHQAAQIVAAGG
jgi:flagellar protein FliS